MTSKEFARLLGVSQSTVSRALNGNSQISEETTRFIREKADEYGFVLNAQARSLKCKKTGTIGILFPQYWESLTNNLMLTYVYDIILKELILMDYDALMIYDIEKTTCEGSLARIIRSRKVDGFINLRSSLSDKELQLIDSYEAPCVSVFQHQHTLQPVSQYSADDYQAGYLAGEYFSRQNNYCPVFISIPLTRKSASNRYDGYCAALAMQGMKPIAITDCDLSYKSAFRTIMTHKKLFLQQPCSVFVYNDIMALGANRAFIELGLSVPGQVQLIGLDGIPMGSWASPTLSTLVTPVHDMVHDGCQTLKRMLDGEILEIEHKLYLPTLVHRETTLG